MILKQQTPTCAAVIPSSWFSQRVSGISCFCASNSFHWSVKESHFLSFTRANAATASQKRLELRNVAGFSRMTLSREVKLSGVVVENWTMLKRATASSRLTHSAHSAENSPALKEYNSKWIERFPTLIYWEVVLWAFQFLVRFLYRPSRTEVHCEQSHSLWQSWQNALFCLGLARMLPKSLFNWF